MQKQPRILRFEETVIMWVPLHVSAGNRGEKHEETDHACSGSGKNRQVVSFDMILFLWCCLHVPSSQASPSPLQYLSSRRQQRKFRALLHDEGLEVRRLYVSLRLGAMLRVRLTVINFTTLSSRM